MNNYRFLKKLLLLCFLPIGLAAVLHSCKPDDPYTPADFKYDYFPLDSGHYVIYQVDSVSANSYSGPKDTARYQLMHMIGDTFYDSNNELNSKLWLYRREDATSPWVFDRLWSVKRKLATAESNEDDIRFIKLVFPPDISQTWNGNAFIPSENDPFTDFRNWDYHYEAVDAHYEINGYVTDSSLTMVAVKDSNFLENRIRKEIYARHVGMIYQDWGLRDKQSSERWDTARFWKGFMIKMRMIDHN